MLIKKENQKIWTANNPKEEEFLTQPTKLVDFDDFNKKELQELVLHMRTMMIASRGVGLSANQIGLDMKVFVAQEADEDGGYKGKFYAVFNPEIISSSKSEEEDVEGCLSVPNVYGTVSRNKSIKVKGQDKNGREIEISVKGHLARIFQHEIDHLNGILFTSKSEDAKKIDEL